ncbi:hypothetical protein CN917_02925 [Bacillus thuringiensis]|nr:hypothetical protein CN917_02925 [Bacillus thuringiensis]SFK66889.1 hypothetical protein SAMN04488573_1011029 [Bacillus sp. 5mfcol3.1]
MGELYKKIVKVNNMKREEIYQILRSETKFEIVNDDKYNIDFYNNGMEIWENSDRMLVLKEYKSDISFANWLLEDQSKIATLYNNISSKYKNNLYFLLILNFTISTDEWIINEVNKAEKNNKVCRKYVIHSKDDLEKIPFISAKKLNDVAFNYKKEFSQRILNMFKNQEKERSMEEIEFGDEINGNILELIDYYLDELDDGEDVEEKISKIMNLGEEDEN